MAFFLYEFLIDRGPIETTLNLEPGSQITLQPVGASDDAAIRDKMSGSVQFRLTAGENETVEVDVIAYSAISYSEQIEIVSIGEGNPGQIDPETLEGHVMLPLQLCIEGGTTTEATVDISVQLAADNQFVRVSATWNANLALRGSDLAEFIIVLFCLFECKCISFQVTSRTVSLEHIHFDHDKFAMTNDAFHIRVNKAKEIKPPEWRVGYEKPEKSPAAYAIQETKGKTLRIKARFFIRPKPKDKNTEVEIRAKGGGLLGEISAKKVKFVYGVSVNDTNPKNLQAVFDLSKANLGTKIKREDITWNWEYRFDANEQWKPLISTQHRIYVVLRQPPAPWSQTDPNNYPWTEVLDHVCDNKVAGGQESIEAAATEIVKHIYDKHGAEYNTINGAGVYTENSTGRFLLTTYLKNIPTVRIVGCYDCAAPTTVFSTSVGCPMTYNYHEPFGYLKPVYPIGQTKPCNNPFFNSSAVNVVNGKPYPGTKRFRIYTRMTGPDNIYRSRFVNHAYAKMMDGMNGKVYDATMKSGANNFLVDLAQAKYETLVIDNSAQDKLFVGYPDQRYITAVNEERIVLRNAATGKDSSKLETANGTPTARSIKLE